MVHTMAALLGWLRDAAGRLALDEHLVERCQTLAGTCCVVDTHDADGAAVRVLEVDGTWQSACYLGDAWAEPVFAYHRLYERLFDVTPGARRLLVLGGGGMSFPTAAIARHDDVSVDAVELDAEVIRVAREHFALGRLEELTHAQRDGRLRIVQGDARGFLEDADARWDAILNDCFSAEEPLGSLMTAEAARTIHERLAPGGVYLTNVVSALEGPRSQPVRDVVAALEGHFAHVRVLPCGADEPTLPDNNVVVAFDHDCELAPTWGLSDAPAPRVRHDA